MSSGLPPGGAGPPAERGARRIADGFEAWRAGFRALSSRAADRFAARDWHGIQADARDRIDLYGAQVERTVEELRGILGPAPDPEAGSAVKDAYTAWCAPRPDVELAETFFNSAVRRVFGTAAVDPRTEFAAEEVDVPPPGEGACRREPVADEPAGLETALHRVLGRIRLGTPLRAPAEDARLAAAAIRRELGTAPAEIEILPRVFYRNKGAYVVGRLRFTDRDPAPLLLAFVHPPAGVELDAVLLTSDEASTVFGFTRSYFHVDEERPRETIDFLRALLPHRRIDELYTAIGHHKHGKTLLYRALMRQLARSDARFETAPGARGLVMAVFTLSSFNVVFKVIRDRFGPPKRTTRRQVREQYRHIFMRDRVGRLADAQEFEELSLPVDRFTPEVLDELRRDAPSMLRHEGDRIVLRHLYVERRVRPLDLFLQEAPPDAARAALADYGRCIKELAAANLFPGDLLLKNFGVTRHGRVIFYDYDEVAPLDACRFRSFPPPRDDADELAAEPWFPVRDGDVFPEEFGSFLGAAGAAGELFGRLHADLFTVAFWRDLQERQNAGEVIDFFPYPASRRLRNGSQWHHSSPGIR
jgi:isocitrate dehydrogenase kinase/phosphatase